jgi:hypothetical protein
MPPSVIAMRYPFSSASVAITRVTSPWLIPYPISSGPNYRAELPYQPDAVQICSVSAGSVTITSAI